MGGFEKEKDDSTCIFTLDVELYIKPIVKEMNDPYTIQFRMLFYTEPRTRDSGSFGRTKHGWVNDRLD